jgi:hypothetical protein
LELKPILNIPEANLKIRCTLFEDNIGAEELAKVPRNRPSNKHIDVKYFHFRSVVRDGYLLVKQVDTLEQLADIFTKPLARQPLEYLRQQIMGWTAIILQGNSTVEQF